MKQIWVIYYYGISKCASLSSLINVIDWAAITLFLEKSLFAKQLALHPSDIFTYALSEHCQFSCPVLKHTGLRKFWIHYIMGKDKGFCSWQAPSVVLLNQTCPVLSVKQMWHWDLSSWKSRQWSRTSLSPSANGPVSCSNTGKSLPKMPGWPNIFVSP